MKAPNTVSEKDLRSDGTLRRKYETEEGAERRAGVWAAAGVIFAGFGLALKEIFFGEDAEARQNKRSGGDQKTAQKVADDGPQLKLSEARPQQPSNPDDVSALSDGDKNGGRKSSDGSAKRFDRSDFSTSKPTTPFDDRDPYETISRESNVIPLTPRRRPDDHFRFGQEGGGPRSSFRPGDRLRDDDEDEREDDTLTNRLPTVSTPVVLSELYVNQSIVIGMGMLLSGALDADGDALTIENLAASSGDLVANGDGSWTFTPDEWAYGQVAFSYQVSDGVGAVSQTATLDVMALPGEEFVGDAGADTLIGTAGNDQFDAGDGDDLIWGREGDDVIEAGDGSDRIIGGEGDDVIHAGVGDDLVFAGGGDDLVFGGEGRDQLWGEDGDDTLFGDGGDDMIEGGEGSDRLFGGFGADVLRGDAGKDLLFGEEGADALMGGDGGDTLVGGEGDDVIEGGAGDDRIVATVNDGDDSVDGGGGVDTYDASGVSNSVEINLQLGEASGSDIGDDTVTNVENAQGGGGNDIIVGDDGDNELTGGGGNDSVLGGAGDDTFIATEGDGDDLYVGGDGEDTYDASGVSSPVTINLHDGTASGAATGDDTLVDVEHAVGGSGDDTIYAGQEDSTLSGGDGNDIFVFIEPTKSGKGGHWKHEITDFQVGDKIDVSLFDGSASQPGVQKLTLLSGDTEFEGEGQAYFKYEDTDEGTVTILRLNYEIDDDDWDDAEYEIVILGHHELTDDNFIT